MALVLSKMMAPQSLPLLARVLRWSCLMAALVAAGILLPEVTADSGAAAVALLGVPVAVSALSVIVTELVSGAGRVTTWVSAFVLVAWVLLLGLGIGFAFAPAALLQLAASVMASSRGRVAGSA